MTIGRMDRILNYVLAVSVMVLSAVTVLKLRITPEEVQQSVMQQAAEITHEIEKIKSHVSEIDAELSRRGDWMNAIDTEMASRIHKSEVQRWRDEVARMNPQLMLPQID